MVPQKVDELEEIINRYRGKRGVLIQLLLDIQREFAWIPKEAVLLINQRLQIPLSQIYRVASFYKAMSLIPRGKHIINVCLGTACHVRGGPSVMEKVRETLKIKPGETTADMKFTLERVNCLGCCAMGPVVAVDRNYHGKVTPRQVREILESYN